MEDFKFDAPTEENEDKLDVDSSLEKVFNTKNYFTEDIFNWVSGDQTKKPEDIKKLGDDFGNKINWIIGASVIKMYARIPKLIEWTSMVEDRLMAEHSPEVDELDDLLKMYTAFTKDINNVMEFARKFVVQNKELFHDGSDFFDRQLYEKLKTLPTDLIKDYLMLMSIVDSKGHNWLKTLISENINKK